ncbi:MAG: GTPase HflX [Bacilli bacterium]|nr:GTPase HflX [Bacilli bacterium]
MQENEKLEKKAILVGYKTPDNISFEYEMDELKLLCEAINIEVIDSITQSGDSINIKTYLRKGKMNELVDLIEVTGANLIVYNDELSPSQMQNINKLVDVTVYDRTYIILEIFKQRAKTKEALLQVEIATLRYMRARLVGLHEGLSRQRGGGSNGGAYGKGRGETQLEIDRRNVGDRIVLLKKQLAQVTKERALQRKKRSSSQTPIICLVGYTNSGKSSMLNAIMQYSSLQKKEVESKNMLFATLETSSRLIKLANNHSFILTDTVGFVSKLPTVLVEAFKSTLEEITEADLIVHVVDASNPEFEKQIQTTNEVLAEIGVINIPTIYAFNKIDKVDNYLYVPSDYTKVTRTSTVTNRGIETLIKEIEVEVFKGEEQITILLPYSEAKYVNTLKTSSNVEAMEYLEQGIKIKAKVSKNLAKELNRFLIKES